MAKETKSNGQKDIFDRFYTKIEIAQKCLELVDLTQYDMIIEPSAGNGSFSNLIPNCLSFDLKPENDSIQQADWLKLDKTIFTGDKILVIGNPPFGVQSTLALSFINESAKFCDTIAFILPLSFKKESLQDKINHAFHLQNELILPEDSFLLDGKNYNVPCVFQIWQKQEKERPKLKRKLTSHLIDFVSKKEADFRIQRVGGNAGKASFNLDVSSQSNYFIKNKTNMSNEIFVEQINKLNFPSIAFTVGPKSLSKTELIMVLEENFIS